MRPFPLGQTFGLLTVLSEGPRDAAPRRQRRAICRCVCGGQCLVRVEALRFGNTISCGCVLRAWRNQHCTTLNLQHGDADHGEVTDLYQIYQGMIERCYNPKNKNYQYYGARGIHMWSGWTALYACFKQDVLTSIGPRPSPDHTIDRINNDGHYEPGNIRWATRAEQNRNKRPGGRRPRPDALILKFRQNSRIAP